MASGASISMTPSVPISRADEVTSLSSIVRINSTVCPTYFSINFRGLIRSYSKFCSSTDSLSGAFRERILTLGGSICAATPTNHRLCTPVGRVSSRTSLTRPKSWL